ncbi:hypothetical protein ABZ807_12150 [Micromonospora sp. NPDC047548]|uniref:hypothetical protein n=1 Tax=Micromonospora sp. NPDC047548 TaxID=3155624 RepID=UPI0033F56767
MTGNEETVVRALLARAADELPAGGVPTETLLVAGQRAVRRQRGLAAGAVAAVAAVVLLGSAGLVDGAGPSTTRADQGSPSPDRSVPTVAPSRPAQTLSVAAAGAPTTTRGEAPRVAPARFDPTRRSFRLGWVPPGAVHQSSLTGVAILSAEADVPDALVPGGPAEPGPMMGSARSVTVRMGARGVDIFSPQLGSGLVGSGVPVGEAPGRAAAPVDGHPAFLHGDGEQTLLSWEYAPDGWISVTVRSFTEPEQVARQVATGLTWQDQRVTVPFRPVAVPARATLAGVELRTWDGRWLDADARYLVPGGTGAEATRRDLSIGVSNGMFAGDGSDFGRSRTMVDGRLGSAMDGPKGLGAYRVAQLPGCADCVAEVGTESQAALTAVGGRTGALRLAASLRLVPTPTDPANWRPL